MWLERQILNRLTEMDIQRWTYRDRQTEIGREGEREMDRQR
jgi:hypothetical protein